MTRLVGYAYLCDALGLSAFMPSRATSVGPVRSIVHRPDGLLVPDHVSPQTDNVLDHVLFALKHEGTNLQVLAEAVPLITPQHLVQAIHATPTSALVRKVCYLWEHLTKVALQGLPAISGAYSVLFDPDQYITGPSARNSKWRVDFNGLGTLDYCATVRRTPAIQAGVAANILDRTAAFIAQIGVQSADRTLTWAYLSETEHSFAIEQQVPSQSKAEAFVALLHAAHEKAPLSEAYLCSLQSGVVNSAQDRALAYRTEQNWLRRGGLRGASSVSYVPPAPQLLDKLMPEFTALANALPRQIDPIIAASVLSFGFVYLHPFMDGNGRVSRFLFHQALCQSGQLELGRLLPISIAMKRNEDHYLATLQAFSKPARTQWDVRWIDGDQFTFAFKGKDSIYRYWDATACAEFGLLMAEQALEVDLRRETHYIACFDAVYSKVNARYDVRNQTLHELICAALDHGGVISKNKRKKYTDAVKSEAFDYIEECAKQALVHTKG